MRVSARRAPVGLGGNRVPGDGGRRAGGVASDAVPRPPDIPVSRVEGLAGLAAAVARGVPRMGDPLVIADAMARSPERGRPAVAYTCLGVRSPVDGDGVRDHRQGSPAQRSGALSARPARRPFGVGQMNAEYGGRWGEDRVFPRG